MNEAHEQLEVYDAQGNPTGAAKSRAAIHRDGDWHLALFCWIVTTDGRVLLQKRAATKDVWPADTTRAPQDTFRWQSDRALADYRPGPEVASLLLVPLGELASLGDTLVPHDPRMLAALSRR